MSVSNVQTIATHTYLVVANHADANNDNKVDRQELETYLADLEDSSWYTGKYERMQAAENMLEHFHLFDNRNQPHTIQTLNIIEGEDGFIRNSEIKALAAYDGDQTTIGKGDMTPVSDVDEEPAPEPEPSPNPEPGTGLNQIQKMLMQFMMMLMFQFMGQQYQY